MSRLVPALTLFALVTVNVVLLEPPPRERRGKHQAPLLPRAEVVAALGAPYLQMVADYFWVMTTHQVGSARTVSEYRDIYAYTDLLTDLDPRFRQPYLYAGVSLPTRDRTGTWRNTQESTRILRKGLLHFPGHVYMSIMLAYNLTHFEHDYRAAAEVLSKAAKEPGAPGYLAPLATRLYAQAGDFDAGLFLAQSLAEAADDEEVRAAFEKRTLELTLERELRLVDEAHARFLQRVGRPPASVEALVQAGDLQRVPVDPFGGSILLGEDGRSRSTSQPKRLTDFALPESEARP